MPATKVGTNKISVWQHADRDFVIILKTCIAKNRPQNAHDSLLLKYRNAF